MSDYLNITDFLLPIETYFFAKDEDFKFGQIGKNITIYEEEFPELDDVDIVLLGCNETRGGGYLADESAADAIRKEFYNLFQWHQDMKIADIGNIKKGEHLADTYAALKVVISELTSLGKSVVVLGGSHDLTLAQYYAYADEKKIVDGACVDAVVDIDLDSSLRADNFLMELLTAEPNYLKHYNHLAFQSYLVQPSMLETMDKLRFDCFRVGHVKDAIEEMEPVIRNCHFFSFDIAAIAHAFAPANDVTPNGLNGEEACTLMQYAGMSANMQSVGVYGYQPLKDHHALTAKQISQMIWYFIDGKSKGKREATMDAEKKDFNEFMLAHDEIEITFFQSKKTGRWWMQLPDKKIIACSKNDYLKALENEIPERWLRAQERL